MNFINEKILKIFNNVDLWIKLLEKALLIVIIIVVAIMSVKILNKIMDYIKIKVSILKVFVKSYYMILMV